MLGPPPLESPGERLEVAVEVEELLVEVEESGLEAVEVEELPYERELWWLCDTEVAGSGDKPAPLPTGCSV